MKPHQGLAQAATCQLWPQNFAASAAVDVLSPPASSPHFSLSGRGVVGYLTNGSDVYPSHTKVSKVLPGCQSFSSFIDLICLLEEGCLLGFLLSGKSVSVQASGRSFPACQLGLGPS